MRDYAKISTSLWRSRKWRKIGDDARLLYLYLHTCPHVNSVGCFILPTGYALDDLKWEKERYRYGIETLCEADLIGFDEPEEMVRIVDFLDFDPFANPKHAEGSIRIAFKLPDCPQRELLFNDLRSSKHVAAGKIPPPKNTVSIPYGDSIDIQNQNQNPSQSQNIDDVDVSARGDQTLREQILSIIGVDPVSGLTGRGGQMIGRAVDMAEVSRWLELPGMDEAHVLTVVRECMSKLKAAPSAFKYFTPAMQALSGQLAAPPLQPTAGQAPRTGDQPSLADTIIARIQAQDAAAAEDAAK